MVEKIISQHYQEWTNGIEDNVQKRIAIFEKIRDIPFALIPRLTDPDTGAAGILELREGSCSPKHYLNAEMYGILEIPFLYATYTFRWADLPVDFPHKTVYCLYRAGP